MEKVIVFFLILGVSVNCFAADNDTIVPMYQVTLSEAHVGNLKVDTKLLDSYELLPENIRDFYLNSRAVLSSDPDTDFSNPLILKTAKKYNIPLMGGPMLGKLQTTSVNIWLRPSSTDEITVKVSASDGSSERSYKEKSVGPGKEQRMDLDGLLADTNYHYVVFTNKKKVGEGTFKTAPSSNQKEIFKLVFGSCFHKIGLHNPNLINQILKRKPQAMMLLGDIAADDRENRINMHRADYLLRDVSKPWRQLAANVPLYASWDDHDYLNNDLSGIPKGFTEADIDSLRAMWQQNWVNPENQGEGIYFNTRIGPVEIIMLDTRSCRQQENRGEYGSYLGTEQLAWLKETLKNSTAPFKVISSGTMWSDDISNGKDSWGIWDTQAREEIFNFIEKENIPGVLLISGDRHGARGFTIPRPSGFIFYEFEAASLGGVPGPDALAKDATNQLFGYPGKDVIAFGEFTFDTSGEKPIVTFRLIDQYGSVLEKYILPYQKLSP